MGKDGKNAKRYTTTFTKEQFAALERIADANKVTVTWLIRRAVDHLIDSVDGAAGGPMLPFDVR